MFAQVKVGNRSLVNVEFKGIKGAGGGLGGVVSRIIVPLTGPTVPFMFLAQKKTLTFPSVPLRFHETTGDENDVQEPCVWLLLRQYSEMPKPKSLADTCTAFVKFAAPFSTIPSPEGEDRGLYLKAIAQSSHQTLTVVV